MSVTVVDASALAAVLFDEPESEPIVASIGGSLAAPSLLPYEIANVCSAKLSMRSADAKAILSRYGLLLDLDIELTEPDWQRLPMLARAWSLSAYDAAYLQLALVYNAPLVTLDARLAAAYDKASHKRGRR
jgi:predicted nucleic acid-binding protein